MIRDGKMAKCFKSFVVLSDDHSPIPVKDMEAFNHLKFWFQGIQYPLLTSLSTRHACGTQICMQS